MALSPIELKLTKARINLITAQPFFGSLALRLKLIENRKIETAVCNGVDIQYNPDYVEKLPLAKVQGMIAHLVMHPAMLHHTRRGDRDKKRWNEACDHSINWILKEAGFDLPEGRFCDPKFKGKVAEEIYTMLPVPPPKNCKGKGKGSGAGQGAPSSGDNGDGEAGDGEGNDPGGDGGVEDSPNSQAAGASNSEQNNEEAEWKVAVAQAAHVAKQQGKLPGGMDRVLQDLLEPVLPWKDILRRFMTEKANDDFSWARGNRRFTAQGLYLPSRYSEGTGEMVCVIDTSGSIGEKELREFGSEIAAIVKDVRPSKTYVIYCDAAVAHVDTFGPDDELVFKAHGGGGTDFRPPFKWLENNNVEPKCLVYLTDGYGAFPAEEPFFPTMWCINNNDVKPPIGEHLVMLPQ